MRKSLIGSVLFLVVTAIVMAEGTQKASYTIEDSNMEMGEWFTFEAYDNKELSPYYLVDQQHYYPSRDTRHSPTRLNGSRAARQFVLRAVPIQEVRRLGLNPDNMAPLTYGELRNW